MKKAMICLLTLALTFGLCLSGCGRRAVQENPDAENGFTENPEMENSGVFAGGTGTEDDPYVITTVSGLDAVRNDLTACYRLDADIDLSGVEWTPIGAFIPAGEENEEREIPVMENAFTGIFDGGSHTLSRLTVNQPETVAVGLFGCIRNAHIYNVSVASAGVDGNSMTGAVVGYAYNSRLTAVSLTGNNFVTGYNNESENIEKIGGMVGGAKNSLMDSCAARANVIVPENAGGVGILCGGLEVTSVINGYATGTLTAGSDCYALGGICGSSTGSEKIINCTAENIRIATGDNVHFVGGLSGYTGKYEDESGAYVTVVSRCAVNNVEIVTGEEAAEISGMIGNGLHSTEENVPDTFTVENCTMSGVTVNGEEMFLNGEAPEEH